MSAVSRPVSSKRPSDRKEMILASASRLFCERGYAGVAVEDIASVVGISAPAVYRHFRNKGQLLLACLESCIARLEKAVAAGHSAEDLARVLAALSLDDREFGVLISRESSHLEPPSRRVTEGRLIDLCDGIAERIAVGRPDLSAEALDIAARVVLAVAVSTSFNSTARGTEQEAEVVREAIVAVCREIRLPSLQLSAVEHGAEIEPQARPWLSRADALLAIAPRLVGVRGSYDATTLEDVGAAVGMTASSVYTYFPSKADLFTAVAERSYGWGNAGLERALALSGSGEDAMRRALLSFIDLGEGFTTFAAEPPGSDMMRPSSTVWPLVARNMRLWRDCAAAARPDLDEAGRGVRLHAALGAVNTLRRAAYGLAMTPTPEGLVEIGLLIMLHN